MASLHFLLTKSSLGFFSTLYAILFIIVAKNPSVIQNEAALPFNAESQAAWHMITAAEQKLANIPDLNPAEYYHLMLEELDQIPREGLAKEVEVHLFKYEALALNYIQAEIDRAKERIKIEQASPSPAEEIQVLEDYFAAHVFSPLAQKQTDLSLEKQYIEAMQAIH